ncbi:UNVERIFIED_CONTAM: DUF1211 domain-containing protein, partial [Lacticaseibacillus paracasei]
ILTIMGLEVKTPETAKLTGIIPLLPFFFSYIVSFLFVGVAWFNPHYIFFFSLRISKKVYLINNLWPFIIFFMSVATGLVGEVSQSSWPGVRYLVVFLFLFC